MFIFPSNGKPQNLSNPSSRNPLVRSVQVITSMEFSPDLLKSSLWDPSAKRERVVLGGRHEEWEAWIKNWRLEMVLLSRTPWIILHIFILSWHVDLFKAVAGPSWNPSQWIMAQQSEQSAIQRKMPSHHMKLCHPVQFVGCKHAANLGMVLFSMFVLPSILHYFWNITKHIFIHSYYIRLWLVLTTGKNILISLENCHKCK